MEKKEHNLLINVDELTWGFPDAHAYLFDKFNFSLYKGDFTILMGTSGSGKTVFSKFLTGKLPAPKKTIFYKMTDLATLSGDELQLYRRKMGIIFQDSKLLKNMSVKDNIIYPLRIYGLGEATIETKYERIKRELGIAKFEDRDIHRMSGGERQLVNIARAVIHDPEFIIADEPTGNLDWKNTQKVADIFIDLNRKGKTILLITHDIHLLNYIKKNVNINLFKL